MAGLRSVDLKMARPRDDKSPEDVYIFPVLKTVLANEFNELTCHYQRAYAASSPN